MPATARIDFYFEQMLGKMKRGNRLYVFKSHKEQPDDEITLDYVMDNCVIRGTVNKVVDELLKMREETGDFGEIVYAGMDWVDPALGQPFDAADGRGSDAARQRGDRQVRRGRVTGSHRIPIKKAGLGPPLHFVFSETQRGAGSGDDAIDPFCAAGPPCGAGAGAALAGTGTALAVCAGELAGSTTTRVPVCTRL